MMNSKTIETEQTEGNFIESMSEPENVTRKAVHRSRILKARKEAKFTARLNQDDFDKFKQLAVEKGMAYQTLLGHIIHLYVEQKLVDVSELKKVFNFDRAA